MAAAKNTKLFTKIIIHQRKVNGEDVDELTIQRIPDPDESEMPDESTGKMANTSKIRPQVSFAQKTGANLTDPVKQEPFDFGNESPKRSSIHSPRRLDSKLDEVSDNCSPKEGIVTATGKKKMPGTPYVSKVTRKYNFEETSTRETKEIRLKRWDNTCALEDISPDPSVAHRKKAKYNLESIPTDDIAYGQVGNSQVANRFFKSKEMASGSLIQHSKDQAASDAVKNELNLNITDNEKVKEADELLLLNLNSDSLKKYIEDFSEKMNKFNSEMIEKAEKEWTLTEQKISNVTKCAKNVDKNTEGLYTNVPRKSTRNRSIENSSAKSEVVSQGNQVTVASTSKIAKTHLKQKEKTGVADPERPSQQTKNTKNLKKVRDINLEQDSNEKPKSYETNTARNLRKKKEKSKGPAPKVTLEEVENVQVSKLDQSHKKKLEQSLDKVTDETSSEEHIIPIQRKSLTRSCKKIKPAANEVEHPAQNVKGKKKK